MSWLSPAVTTPPSDEPVSVEEARAQCSIAADDDTFDLELGIYVQAAREHAEAYTGLKIMAQTVSLKASCFSDLERLPTAPIASIASVKYLDTDGAEQTLDAAVYEDHLEAELQPEVRLKVNQTWPVIRQVSDAVRVSAVAGYANAAAVPAALKLAILLMVGDWFANREDTTPGRLERMPNGAATLLENFRLTA